MIENSKNKIEDEKMHLYDVKDKNVNHHLEGVLHQVGHKVSTEWDNEEENNYKEDMKNRKPKMSIFKKFFIASIVFFLIAAGFAVYMFYNKDTSVSNDKVDITVIGNAFTKGGEELPLQVEIVNRNNVNLELVNLIVEYPSGASDDVTEMTRLPREVIGAINKGESVTKNIKVKLYGEEKSVRNVKVSIEYHGEGSNAVLTKETSYPVTISIAPLSLFIEAPDTATVDQEISFNIKAVLNTSLPDVNTVLQLSYPNNFVFEDSSIKPDFGNSVWGLSTLNTETPFNLNIKGRMIGQSGDEQVFHVYAGVENSSDKSRVSVTYNSLLHTVLIVKPFLEAKILASDSVSSGDTVNVNVAWTNNLSTQVTDAIITAEIKGNGLVDKSIETDEGFYDSSNNKIIWDKNTVPDIGTIEPGEKGTFKFSFKAKSFTGLYDTVKDPQVSIDVSIKGRQPSLGSTLQEVNNFSNKIVKIGSDFQIVAGANYLSGNLPPKAETETKYSITWTLSNTVNNITGAKAVTILPVYVKWVSAEPGQNITYNDFTREVTWNIGSVSSNTGVNSNKEASFIISLNSSTSQIGSTPQLIKETKLTGLDAFVGDTISITQNAVTTNLMNSSNNIGAGRVVE